MFGHATLTGACLAVLQSVAHAHMTMNQPFPFGSPDNSPLDATGSNFPCKFGSDGYTATLTKMNNMPVGVPQTLSFTGGATHGGGSCQVSLTMDKIPNKNSQWKVIHSIEGGCPSNATGNLSEDSSGHGATTYHFSIPKGMPNGQYSLAWTWFNKIGNREMYMNCAPITVTGGTNGDMSSFNSLPDMMVANIGSPPTCTVDEGVDVKFPNPGASVETYPGSSLGPPKGNCARTTSSGSSQPPAPIANPPKAGAPPAASRPAPSPSYSPAASAPPVSPSAPPVAPGSGGYVPPPPAAASVPAPAPASGATSGSCASGKVPCSSPGSIVCVGAAQFGLCDIDNCAVPQALALGTHCSGGQITKRYVPVPPLARRGNFYARAFEA